MLAKYNDKVYIYLQNQNRLITRFEDKIDSDFKKEYDYYYLDLEDDSKISDIFEYVFLIEINSKDPTINGKWEIGHNDSVKEYSVRIDSTKPFPGWRQIEKDEYVKFVDIDDIESYKIVVITTKKDYNYVNEVLEFSFPFEIFKETYENLNINTF